MMAQKKKDEFDKTVDHEVKKGAEEVDHEESDAYQSDDDSLMQEYHGLGENTPFRTHKMGNMASGGPNLLLLNDEDENALLQEDNNETNEMIKKMMKTGTNFNSRELEQFLANVKNQ